jgi:hypothetical protein
MTVSAAALWGMAPSAEASPPQTSIFQKRPPTVQKPQRFLFGSVRRSEYTTSRRSVPSSIPIAPQLGVVNIQPSQPVIVRPPVYTSAAASASTAASIEANAGTRSRLVLPVLPQASPQVPAASSEESSISPAPAEVSIAPIKAKAQPAVKAAPVWPPEPDQPRYGIPIYGRPGFVRPPDVLADPSIVIDVRDFVPGQKVRDPKTGMVFLVPPL